MQCLECVRNNVSEGYFCRACLANSSDVLAIAPWPQRFSHLRRIPLETRVQLHRSNGGQWSGTGSPNGIHRILDITPLGWTTTREDQPSSRFTFDWTGMLLQSDAHGFSLQTPQASGRGFHLRVDWIHEPG
jgi:hypothetical protein